MTRISKREMRVRKIEMMIGDVLSHAKLSIGASTNLKATREKLYYYDDETLDTLMERLTDMLSRIENIDLIEILND